MFSSYFKTAYRLFKRNKIYGVINLISLCIGMTCVILIYTYVKYELSYDDFFKNANRIYRLEYYSDLRGELNTRYANINQSVNPGSLNSIFGIEKNVRFAPLPDVFAEANGQKIAESDFWAANPSFFTLFDFPLLEGNRNSVLAQPNSIVLTQKTAQKYFGNTRALGRTLNITFQDKSTTLTVTGVTDLPPNTHLHFDAIASKSLTETLYNSKLSEIYLGYNYLQLTKGQHPDAIEKQLHEINKVDYRLKPLTDIHLLSNVRAEISPNSDIRYIYFLSAIAIILLVIASINFTSLSTAQALRRYKEAGIRKVMGADKRQLITQFLFEAIMLSLMALAVSYIVIYYALPSLNLLTGNYQFTFPDFFNLTSIILFILTAVLMGILAGLYPAFLLSAFQPIKTLKQVSPSGKKGTAIWKSIVVIQFAASIAMIICTVTIYRQLHYVQSKDLGFNKERIITVTNTQGDRYAPLKSRLQSLASVEDVSVSSYIPGISKTSGTALVQIAYSSDSLTFNWISVDYDFFDTYGIKLKEGRTFSEEYGTDSTQAFMLNETAVKALGWESPLGKELNAFNRNGTVIGVTQNFNFLSLYQNYSPIIYLIDESLFFNFSIKIAPSNTISNALSQIKETWATMLPNSPFEYQFVDEQFDALYKNDQQMGTMFALFATLALFIACLGLFSLSSFMAINKRKEVSIRKVLGATVTDILLSLYKNYGKLIITACLIATPVSYLFLRNWLQQFAFKITISFWVFLIAIAAILCIAIVTVSYESIKAATANPVNMLKTE
ncbi:ABC transporter permease [Aliifodinibius sp. S!AR15-10]|uniref:ABC transporter permease n=1 Tax=Aliifodinibius sp. S!AR15-10 TaxID=2950437 RepID=UPI002863A05A|nr:ABC transporter permease [Aliifodinibius sp. S!AR15-10]MDR8392325.1 ABC transporter permease [Aliifodinibius sp. S!AR15-10]